MEEVNQTALGLESEARVTVCGRGQEDAGGGREFPVQFELMECQG